MPNPIALNFNNLSNLASVSSDNTSILVKNGGLTTRGRLGSLFTLKSTNRYAGEVLYAAVRQKYGDTIADALAPQMRASREAGKPLRARTVRDVLANAAEMSTGISRINVDMARHFVMGNDGTGKPCNLNTAFEQFCAEHNIDPAAHQDLKQQFGEAILKAAQQETQKIFSYEQLNDLAHKAGLPAMKKAWNDAQVKMFMDDPNGAQAATEACAASLGLNAAQKEQLSKLVGMAASLQAEEAAESGKPFSPQTLFQDVSKADLPALQNFAYACGKRVDIDAVARDVLAWAKPGNVADLCILSNQIGKIGGMAAVALAAQRLDTLRELQPTGLFSRETLWQGCFNEPMPDKLHDASRRDFNHAVFDRLGSIFDDARPDSPTAAADGMTILATGITLDKAVASLRGPVALHLADFANSPTLTPVTNLGTLMDVEASIAKDIKRRGTHNSLPGYMPTINFTTPDGKTETVNIRDTTDMGDEDKANYDAGNPSSISRNLVQQAVRLCGDNDVQARQVILSMGQSGAFLVRSNSSATGIFESEHSPLDIDIRREANGNVTMRFYKPEQSPLDVDYTYTVTPDGHGVLTACRIQARQQPTAQPEAPRAEA